ncbi:MAG: hypothetical protein L0191_20725, partial [Acidobacteria bacterium]|nr:hypothetical protein [Acidobacteriota bacterium]
MPPSIRQAGRPTTMLAVVVMLGAGCWRDSEELEIELASPGETVFTTAAGENRIHLRAKLPSRFESAEVLWRVEQGIGDSWAPVPVPPGEETEIPVSIPPGTTRYRGSHPKTAELRAEQLKRQRIRYRVSAAARRGARSVHSDTLQIQQSMLAAIRQEYLDLGLRRGAPPLDWFEDVAKLPQGLGYGDSDSAVVEPEFMERLAKLEKIWKTDYGLRWQLNSLFRNPVHNRFHVTGGGSGPISNSWHQFGCAADLQTFPVLSPGRSTQRDTVNARQFWDALTQEALLLD